MAISPQQKLANKVPMGSTQRSLRREFGDQSNTETNEDHFSKLLCHLNWNAFHLGNFQNKHHQSLIKQF